MSKQCYNNIHEAHTKKCMDFVYNEVKIKLTTCICGICPDCGKDTTIPTVWEELLIRWNAYDRNTIRQR